MPGAGLIKALWNSEFHFETKLRAGLFSIGFLLDFLPSVNRETMNVGEPPTIYHEATHKRSTFIRQEHLQVPVALQ